jgi:hypothetical protein
MSLFSSLRVQSIQEYFEHFRALYLVMRTLLCPGAIFSLILTSQASADYVYEIQNYAPLQNGWTLNGQITTDTNSGRLATSDILSWNYHVSNGVLSYAFSSTNPASFASVEGNVIATPTAIEIPSPPSSEPNGPAASNALNLNYYPYYPSPYLEASILWERDSGYPGRPYLLDTYFSTYNDNNKIWLAQSSPFSLAPPPTTALDSWVIASATATPEPTSILLLASGLFAAAGGAIYRNRQQIDSRLGRGGTAGGAAPT